MDKAGDFYLTDRHHLLKVIPYPDPWGYVLWDTIATFPDEDIVSLAIDCNENIFAADIETKNVYSYNLKTKQIINYGKYNAHFFDFEFFNGYLHALCYENINGFGAIHLMKIHLDNLNLLDTVSAIIAPDPTESSFGMASNYYNCKQDLFSLKYNAFIHYNSGGKFFTYDTLTDLCLGGATSPTSWMGSFAPLALDSIGIDTVSVGCDARFNITLFPMTGRCDRPGMEYSLDGVKYQSDNTFYNVAGGMITPYLRDSFGCSKACDTLFLSQSALTYTYSVAPDYCHLNAGYARLYGANNTFFAMEGFPFSPDSLVLSGLAGGDYFILVKNTAGCLDTIHLTIPEQPAFTVSPTTLTDTCGRGNGGVTITTQGVRGSVSLSVNGVQYTAGASLSGLSTGSYTLYVKDSTGCIVTQLFTISEIPAPHIDQLALTEPDCNSSDGSITIHASGKSLAYSLNQIHNTTGIFSGLAAGAYAISIIDTFGCQMDTIVILHGKNAAVIDSVSIRDAHCDQTNGAISLHIAGGEPVEVSIDSVSFTPDTQINNLAAGDYTLYVRSALGCISRISLHIDQTGLPAFTHSILIQSTCDSINGSITAHAVGQAPLHYTLNNGKTNDNGYFGALSPGDYTLAVTDSFGCVSDTLIRLDQRGSRAEAEISLSPMECGDRYSIVHFAGASDNSYRILPIQQIAYPGDTLHLSPGDYRLIISNTICSLDTVITIPHSDCPYFIPNVFSPNHDGINDVFKPEGKIDLIALEIYNRWGDHIYTGHGTQAAWDGRFKGKELPPGVYIYWMRIRKADGSESMAKGEVTLLR